jgi:hypothetical protein
VAEKAPDNWPHTHYVFDANAFIGAGWPHISTTLKNLIVTAEDLAVTILIPDLVLQEVEQVWAELTNRSLDKLRGELSRLSRALEGLMPDLLDQTPDKASVEGYQSALLETIRTEWPDGWPLKILPLPKVSLEQAVRQSAQHQPPFAPTDTAFRDSLILWSILEAVPKGASIAIISGDDFYTSEHATAAAKERGVTLKVFKTPADLWREAETALNQITVAEFMDKYHGLQKQLSAVIDAQREELTSFIRHQLDVPEYLPEVSGSIEAVHDLAVKEIRSPTVPFSGTKREAVTTESVVVTIALTATVSRFGLPQRRRFKVGEAQDSGGLASIFSKSLFEKRVETFDVDVLVEMSVTWPENSKDNPTVEFTSVSVPPLSVRALLSRATTE